MVRVGELLRDGRAVTCVGVVEVPADVDGEDEREEVGVAVADGGVQRRVTVLVLHRHLRFIGWKALSSRRSLSFNILLRDKKSVRIIRFGKCLLKVPQLYQPCCLVPCCKGKPGGLTVNKT